MSGKTGQKKKKAYINIENEKGNIITDRSD